MARWFAGDRAPRTPAPRRAVAVYRDRRHRFTAFITDTPAGGPARQHADLEVRHRSHARVEDRIRCGKATGLRNLPCRGYQQNKAWLELALTAADLLTWTQALCLDGELARCEQQRCATGCCTWPRDWCRTGRRWHLKIDKRLALGHPPRDAFARLRAAPWPA